MIRVGFPTLLVIFYLHVIYYYCYYVIMLNILKQHSLANEVFGTKSYVQKEKEGDVNVYSMLTQESSSLFFNFY